MRKSTIGLLLACFVLCQVIGIISLYNVAMERASLKAEIKQLRSVTAHQKALLDGLAVKDEHRYKAEVLEREPEVQYDLNDLRKPSYATAEYIDKKLEGTRMQGLGQAYVDAERENGINALFLCAKDINESGWGESKIAREKFNIAGYQAYNGSVSRSAKRFDSFADCIAQVSEKLRIDYLTPSHEGTVEDAPPTGRYFNGYGIRDVNVRYAREGNGPNWNWSRNIAAIMQKLAQ